MKNSSNPASVFWRGVCAELPIQLGVFPFGMIFGALAVNAGFSGITAGAMSLIIFAGSSQILAVQLISQGTPLWVVFLTGVVVNLRHSLYSASIAPYVQKISRCWQAGLAYLLTDEAYAVTVQNYRNHEEDPVLHRWFFSGAGLTLWLSWQLSTMLGVLLGEIIPQNIPLDFSLPLVFIAVVVPDIQDKPALLAAAVAAVLSILTFGFPLKLGLLVSAFLAIGVGVWCERNLCKSGS